MPASDTAGRPKNRIRRVRRPSSLTTKAGLLAFIFVLVPVILYIQFRSAYEDSQDLLLRSVRDEGRVISQSLLPLLDTATMASLPDLGHQLARFAGEVTTIKLLLAPAGVDAFYYVASWPTVAESNLEAERQILQQQGVLDRLSRGCQGEMPFSLIYKRPTGGAEIVTAVTPLSTQAGCWAVVASFAAEAFPSAHLGQPYWETPTVQIAALIYLVMVVITFSTLFSIAGGLRRFVQRARQIREGGPNTGGFTSGSEIVPELADVAAEFDRMVESLDRSAATIRRAAEDNAHAFKLPIAVIRQSVEPLRRLLPKDNQRAQRAIEGIDSSLDRLDGLVASSRRLDEATADLLSERRVPIDLERVLGRLIQIRTGHLPGRDTAIRGELRPGTLVLGTEEMIETILENLIDNAMSFSPAGSQVRVRLTREDGYALIAVSDDGPGVPGEQLERIFDRYYSERRVEETSDKPPTYFGIGLSIARRNVEAMGGAIRAENRDPHGLTVHVRLPLVDSRNSGNRAP